MADLAVYYILDFKFDMKQNSKLAIQWIKVGGRPETKFDIMKNGKPIPQADTEAGTHTDSSMLAAHCLIAKHLRFGVITKKSLATKLTRAQVLVLSNVHFMDAEEVGTIRDWGHSGGALYARGGTSLVNQRGQLQPDFLLADVFGVSIAKPDGIEREHYIAPTSTDRGRFPGWDAKYPAYIRGPGMEVCARSGTTALATTTMPWPPSAPREFSSIHRNPPWTPTEQPEVVLNTIGKGRGIYCAPAQWQRTEVPSMHRRSHLHSAVPRVAVNVRTKLSLKIKQK